MRLQTEGFRFTPAPGSESLHSQLPAGSSDAIGKSIKTAKSHFPGLQVSEGNPGRPDGFNPDRNPFSIPDDRENLTQTEHTGSNEEFLFP